ncbi:MAG TPA: biotin/lipoyl-binding protein [Candidatus Angelobacter sp.]
MKRWFIPVIAAFALTFGIISVVRSQPRQEATNPPVRPPESAFARNVAAVGLVETSTENIAIGSHLPGVVEKVFVTVGDPVKAGAPLFKIDHRNLRAQLIQAEAGEQAAEARVSVASAALDDLRQQLKFAEDVTDPRAISAEEVTRRRSAVQTAKAKLSEAEAEVGAARAQIAMVKTELERSIVTSPIAGEVLQVKIRAGEFAVAGATATPMILLGRAKPLYLRVDVDEQEAWRVRPEANATATVRGNTGLATPLKFVRFEPFVLPKKSLTGDSSERVDTRVLQVIYRVQRDDLRLFVGQQMDVFIDAPVVSASSKTSSKVAGTGR